MQLKIDLLLQSTYVDPNMAVVQELLSQNLLDSC